MSLGKNNLQAFMGLLMLLFTACAAETEFVELAKEFSNEVVLQKTVVSAVPDDTITVTKEVEAIKEVPKTITIEKVLKGQKEVKKDHGELVIYSGRSKILIGSLVKMFEEATGVDVKAKYGKTFPIAAMILEEGENSPADIYIAQDPGGLGFLSSEGRLIELPGSVTKRVADWAKPSDGTWVGLSARARTLVHTASMNVSELPTSLEDLTDPKWKGRLGWAPTNSSFQTMITGMRVLWGEEKTRVWLEDMMANKPIIYPNNSPQVAAAAAGEISIGLVNHYYLHRFVSEHGEDFNARNLYLSDEGPGSLVMIAGAGILDTSKNKKNAEKFLVFMTSKVAQQYFTSQAFEYPVVDGVKTHKFLPSFAELQMPDLTIEDLSDLKGTQKIFMELGMLD